MFMHLPYFCLLLSAWKRVTVLVSTRGENFMQRHELHQVGTIRGWPQSPSTTGLLSWFPHFPAVWLWISPSAMTQFPHLKNGRKNTHISLCKLSDVTHVKLLIMPGTYLDSIYCVYYYVICISKRGSSKDFEYRIAWSKMGFLGK